VEPATAGRLTTPAYASKQAPPSGAFHSILIAGNPCHLFRSARHIRMRICDAFHRHFI